MGPRWGYVAIPYAEPGTWELHPRSHLIDFPHGRSECGWVADIAPSTSLASTLVVPLYFLFVPKVMICILGHIRLTSRKGGPNVVGLLALGRLHL